jgi:hypothetical protein
MYMIWYYTLRYSIAQYMVYDLVLCNNSQSVQDELERNNDGFIYIYGWIS